MSNFFNAIGVADMEKVHSAMIAWILDDANDRKHPNYAIGKTNFSTLPIEERSKLLCEMFNVEPTGKFDTIRTHVEWNDIDIMIITEKDNTKEIWVIENKLKSSEHLSNDDNGGKIWQTEKYVRIINTHDVYKELDQHYILLSLGGDKARYSETEELLRKYKHHEWKSLTYKNFEEYLSKVLDIQSYPLIDEYLDAISHLSTELEEFLNNPLAHPDVFAPKKTKEKKAKLLFEEPLKENVKKAYYILENGLETIFQKEFLKKIVDDAQLKTLKEGMVIDEDNGTAEFDYTIARFDKDAKVDDNGNLLFQIQFQNGAFKVVIIHQNYRNNKPEHFEDIYGNKDKLDGKWYKIFNDVLINNCGGKEGWDLHKAQNIEKNDNPKPRISFTKNIGPEWYKNIDIFKEGFKEAVEFAKSILDSEDIKGDKPHIKYVLSKLSMT